MERTPLLERAAHLARVGSALSGAACGTGRLLLITGAPGIGRTRLLDAIADVAHREGALALHGRGSLLGSEADEPPGPELVSRSRAAMAAGGVAAILVDDAQWLDGASLRALGRLAARGRASAVIVLAVRDGEPATDPAALAELADTADEAVSLAPLSRRAVARALGCDEDARLAETAHRETGGVPGLVAAAGEALGRAGDAFALAARALAPALGRRLERLDGDAPAVAAALAVLGDGVDLAAVAEVAQLDVAACARAADRLVAAHVLADDPAPAFAQPLVRRAAALLQGPHQRAAAHGRATALLLARGAPPDRVAAHALHAPPSDDPRVVEALATAATDALDRGAPAAAVRLLVRALAEPPAPDHRPAVLAQLGAARLAEDEPTAVATLEAAVAAADDPRAEAAAARELAVALCWHGRYGDALTVLEQARGRLVSVDADAALLLDAVLFSTHFPLVSRAAYVEELAARMRRQVELDGATLAAGAARLALAVSGACRGASAAWVAGEVAAVVERPAVRATLGPELYGYAPVALWLGGRLRDADALAGSLVDEARATGSRFGARSAHTARAAIRLCAGDVRGAQSDVDAARDGDASPSATFARIGLAGMHAEVLAERDEPLAAQRVLAATAVDPDEDVGVSLMHWHRGRAAVARAVGDAAAERSALRDAGAAAQAWRLANPTMLAWRSRLAPLIADLDEAAELLDGELRVARAQGDHGAIGAALHGAALAATGDRQVELLDAAVERLATSGRALDHARALVDLGAALRRTGRRRDARPFLATGADIAARQHGLALARRAQTELRACGARPRTLVLRGVEALTPSERRVAELAADGRTNREIAQALFVTVKTVETHLAHAYRKLDVRGRRDLAPLLEAERAAEDQGATLRRTDGSPA